MIYDRVISQEVTLFFMDLEKQKNQLLNKLEKVTGISFSINDNELSSEETVAKLKDLLNHCNILESRNAFYSKYILGEISSIDVIQGIHRYRINEDIPRVLMLLESTHPYTKEVSSLLHSFIPNNEDEIIEIDDRHILIISHFTTSPSADEIQQSARELIDILETEAFTTFSVSFDLPCPTFNALPKAYSDVVLAMEIGNIFFGSQRVYAFSDLGFGRLLYNMPKEECLAYINNRVDMSVFDSIDEEILITLHAFFDNDLSIAETARKQFIHRNTLIYRLDKFQNITGLDVRRFSDAMTCKTCLMILDYLKSL